MLAVMTLAAPAVVSLGSASWAYGVTGTETWTSDAPKALEEDITVDSGDNLTISSGDHSTTGQLELKNGGNASMSGGTLDAGSLRIHNINSSTEETFTLSGGTINLSGTDIDTYSAILLGHWHNGTGILNVEGGTLNAVNGRMTVGWDSHGRATISDGVVNVGRRPTVEENGHINCETYIIDFDRDIYGKDVKLSFYKKIRAEKKFSSLDELSSEVKENALWAKNYFENLNKGGTDR